jgi:hypothetical protein
MQEFAGMLSSNISYYNLKFPPVVGSVVAPGPAFPTPDETVIRCSCKMTKTADALGAGNSSV